MGMLVAKTSTGNITTSLLLKLTPPLLVVVVVVVVVVVLVVVAVFAMRMRMVRLVGNWWLW